MLELLGIPHQFRLIGSLDSDILPTTPRPQSANARTEGALQCVDDKRQLVERSADEHNCKRKNLAGGHMAGSEWRRFDDIGIWHLAKAL